METQSYLLINETTNIVENVLIWNGDTQIWSPPQGYIALPLATTPALIWIPVIDLTTKKTTDWELQENIGCGGVGFTWDGTNAITNQPKPAIPN